MFWTISRWPIPYPYNIFHYSLSLLSMNTIVLASIPIHHTPSFLLQWKACSCFTCALDPTPSPLLPELSPFFHALSVFLSLLNSSHQPTNVLWYLYLPFLDPVYPSASHPLSLLSFTATFIESCSYLRCLPLYLPFSLHQIPTGHLALSPTLQKLCSLRSPMTCLLPIQMYSHFTSQQHPTQPNTPSLKYFFSFGLLVLFSNIFTHIAPKRIL